MNREGKSLKVLAFDYGASSGRAILGKFDGERLTLEEIHRFSNDPVQAGAGLHWDILRLYHEMRQGILRYKQKGESDLAGMAIDTWGVDFGLLTASGELLGNPYHYRDSRTDGMIEAPGRDLSVGLDRLIGELERTVHRKGEGYARDLVERLGAGGDDCALVVVTRAANVPAGPGAADLEQRIGGRSG